MNTALIDFFANYIKESLGIVYERSNYYQLEKRLEELAKSEGLNSIEELYGKAKNGIYGSFKTKLLDLATNNETSFFRDPKIFEMIEKEIFPHFVQKGIKDIRVWCAASSFGQEIYSVLMLQQEMASGARPEIREFIGTDISEKALKKAADGIYNHVEMGRGLTPALQNKYFITAKEPNHWQVKIDLRKKVQFKSQNILDPFHHLGKFELILCRNILIYQNVESKKKIIDRLYDQLTDNGILVMGVGESMIGLSSKFEQFSFGSVSIYKKKPASEKKVA
jgi:chemotaxis protein methyltransferase CheR